MAAVRRGSKKRSKKKTAIKRPRKPRTARAGAKGREPAKKPKAPKSKAPRKPLRPRRPKPRAITRAPAEVDTIDLEFTWAGGAEATLLTLVDHQRERLNPRPRDRQRITVRYSCDFGGVHPIQWDLSADSDMKSPILRGRKNDEPVRTLAQSPDTSRWSDRIFL